ncbi:hypothetical protein F5B22DRAFT_605114 [Xylaria bambusicola]|uniref:uncharacterized protein n=1 Tax=Xylaria bambusicola TaxID=326684 RepID=UPI002008314F|nr:uncharacterized protein F5B22DRAFT_605114 [Xylaria bambusicola]KAI0517163.1 hypothetical protein F5B22DRAFT_605114 [Xylaria bambusicola]
MKLNSFLLPALAGVATAVDSAPQQAEVFMLRAPKQTTSNPPTIPNSLAEAILLQRLSTPDKPSTLGQLPESLDGDEAISYINQFGKPPRPLFDVSDANEPKQLVIAFSGITAKHHGNLLRAIPDVPLVFTTSGLGPLPAKVTSKCTFGQSVDPKEGGSSKCWSGNTQYLHYDLKKDSTIIGKLSNQQHALKEHANAGLMETTFVFLDTDSTTSNDNLHRRQLQSQKETKNDGLDASFVESTHGKTFNALAGRPTPVPNCFTSQSACENATNSCFGHGECVNRWGKDDTDKTCFFCHCGTTVDTDSKGKKHVYRWGGGMCQKRDISTPFWLFAGVTIALVATIAFSIGLLFSVGEEKLPGVIGAGVSRSK